jgi:nicotinic acid mononucleotide adenylyltransferase
MVIELLGELDLFVTANPYVESLLRKDYPIVHPLELIPVEKQMQVDGSRVRRAMARGEDWESLVPARVAEYLKSNKLDERFRREFGLQTLALETILQ